MSHGNPAAQLAASHFFSSADQQPFVALHSPFVTSIFHIYSINLSYYFCFSIKLQLLTSVLSLFLYGRQFFTEVLCSFICNKRIGIFQHLWSESKYFEESGVNLNWAELIAARNSIFEDPLALLKELRFKGCAFCRFVLSVCQALLKVVSFPDWFHEQLTSCSFLNMNSPKTFPKAFY